ncbi:MAG: hypothetical protein ACPG51_18940 [Thiolinea sp.]
MSKIFISCPECGLEHAIREKFGEASFFVSALGGVITSEQSTLMGSIELLIKDQGAESLSVVVSPTCRFLFGAPESGINESEIYTAFCKKRGVSTSTLSFDDKNEFLRNDLLPKTLEILANCRIGQNRAMSNEIEIGALLYNAEYKEFDAL